MCWVVKILRRFMGEAPIPLLPMSLPRGSVDCHGILGSTFRSFLNRRDPPQERWKVLSYIVWNVKITVWDAQTVRLIPRVGQPCRSRR